MKRVADAPRASLPFARAECMCVDRVPVCGFWRDEQVLAFASCPMHRLQPVLARMNCGRFIAPAQDVARIVRACVKYTEGEYLRDYSHPVQEG